MELDEIKNNKLCLEEAMARVCTGSDLDGFEADSDSARHDKVWDWG